MKEAIESSSRKSEKRKEVYSPSAKHKLRHSKSPKTRSLGCLPHSLSMTLFKCFRGASCGFLLLPFLALPSCGVTLNSVGGQARMYLAEHLAVSEQ